MMVNREHFIHFFRPRYQVWIRNFLKNHQLVTQDGIQNYVTKRLKESNSEMAQIVFDQMKRVNQKMLELVIAVIEKDQEAQIIKERWDQWGASMSLCATGNTTRESCNPDSFSVSSLKQIHPLVGIFTDGADDDALQSALKIASSKQIQHNLYAAQKITGQLFTDQSALRGMWNSVNRDRGQFETTILNHFNFELKAQKITESQEIAEMFNKRSFAMAQWFSEEFAGNQEQINYNTMSVDDAVTHIWEKVKDIPLNKGFWDKVDIELTNFTHLNNKEAIEKALDQKIKSQKALYIELMEEESATDVNLLQNAQSIRAWINNSNHVNRDGFITSLVKAIQEDMQSGRITVTPDNLWSIINQISNQFDERENTQEQHSTIWKNDAYNILEEVRNKILELIQNGNNQNQQQQQQQQKNYQLQEQEERKRNDDE